MEILLTLSMLRTDFVRWHFETFFSYFSRWHFEIPVADDILKHFSYFRRRYLEIFFSYFNRWHFEIFFLFQLMIFWNIFLISADDILIYFSYFSRWHFDIFSYFSAESIFLTGHAIVSRQFAWKIKTYFRPKISKIYSVYCLLNLPREW